MKFSRTKFHIALTALTVGVAAVYFWNGMSIAWSEVVVDLPEANAEVLPVFPAGYESERPRRYVCDEVADAAAHSACIDQVVFEDRDMSLYASGGVVGCGLEAARSDLTACDASYEKARAFVWEFWRNKKAGHIVIKHASQETRKEWTTHLFIEPTKEGRWRVVERTIPMLAPDEEEVLLGLRLGDLIEVHWEKATEWDRKHRQVKPGTPQLVLTDSVGNSFIL